MKAQEPHSEWKLATSERKRKLPDDLSTQTKSQRKTPFLLLHTINDFQLLDTPILFTYVHTLLAWLIALSLGLRLTLCSYGLKDAFTRAEPYHKNLFTLNKKM